METANSASWASESQGRLPTMLFVRRYITFSGGHLKYCNHLAHIAAFGRFRPLLHVTPDSNADELEALLPMGIERVELPLQCDAIFVAGIDWELLDAGRQDTNACPVINLIQGVRHADPSLPLYKYLTRPALRICVSQEVADAIESTKQTNGPVCVVTNGLDHGELDAIRPPTKKQGLIIAGLKAPALAKAVGTELSTRGIAHDILTKRLPRQEYLSLLSTFEHAVLLPFPVEGFYLPALEAMALGVTVVMPDCIGARAFAVDGTTCAIASRDASALAETAARIAANLTLAVCLRENARIVARNYDIEVERWTLNNIIDSWLR